MKLVLLTDPDMENCTPLLSHIYGSIYVEYVSKNAMIPFDGPIHNELFRTQLQRYITQCPGYQ